MKQSISVIKRTSAGNEIWRYSGTLVRRESHILVIEARFKRRDLPFMGIMLRAGDRFIETYFPDRWYNVFEIHDWENDRLKGWYCNIGKPAVFEADDVISYIDLALDLWVAPDGAQTVLDEDEFAALGLDANTKSNARAALVELQNYFRNNKEPGLF